MTEPEADAPVSGGPTTVAAPGAGVGNADAGVVLVVDDEPAIVESLTKIFKREGLTVLDHFTC